MKRIESTGVRPFDREPSPDRQKTLKRIRPDAAACSSLYQTRLTFSARGPLALCPSLNETACPICNAS
jgi:hypothetical protein